MNTHLSTSSVPFPILSAHSFVSSLHQNSLVYPVFCTDLKVDFLFFFSFLTKELSRSLFTEQTSCSNDYYLLFNNISSTTISLATP